MSKQNINKILDIKYRKDLEKYLSYMLKNKIELMNFQNEKYPTNLYNIADKPAFVYVKGNKDILHEPSVAIVGSRDATEYGKYVSRKIAKQLADKNINIVSGLAKGIDKYSHIGALESGIGKTIAVLRYRCY